MKRTNSAKLTELSVLRAVYERRGKAVTYKTLAELDALGRPPRPAVEALCESLIERGYLFAAEGTKGKGVTVLQNGYAADEHPALWESLIEDQLAAEGHAQAAEASDARDALRDLVNTSIFLKKAAREARCAWTRADDDLSSELVTQLDAWIAKQWETTPKWVQRRRKSVETLCGCFDCQEYGDHGRRREEIKRKMQPCEEAVNTATNPDAADVLDEQITEEMEAELRTQRELQENVEILVARQEELAAQVAAMRQHEDNGTPARRPASGVVPKRGEDEQEVNSVQKGGDDDDP